VATYEQCCAKISNVYFVAILQDLFVVMVVTMLSWHFYPYVLSQDCGLYLVV
jgi:hypothetical protein